MSKGLHNRVYALLLHILKLGLKFGLDLG